MNNQMNTMAFKALSFQIINDAMAQKRVDALIHFYV